MMKKFLEIHALKGSLFRTRILAPILMLLMAVLIFYSFQSYENGSSNIEDSEFLFRLTGVGIVLYLASMGLTVFQAEKEENTK